MALTDPVSMLADYKKAVDRVIFDFLPEHHDVPEVDLLYKMMRDYPSRPAKGLRSSLCIITCEAFGGDPSKALVTAAALELFQNWILIHDDIEDDSDLRRGQPVLQRKYGIPLAINTGDALHGKMWEILFKNRELLSDRLALEVMSEVLYMINQTTEGQHTELTWVRNNRWDLDEEDYFLMVEKKTSWYTCISPCRLGALIAGADSSLLDDLVPFGRSLGIAFQIQDDILNLVAEGVRYGKEAAGDILEGKRTLVLIHLLRICGEEERRRTVEILSRERCKKTVDEVRYILDLVKRYDVIEYAKKRALRFAGEAQDHFDSISKHLQNSVAKEKLQRLIGFMVSREW